MSTRASQGVDGEAQKKKKTWTDGAGRREGLWWTRCQEESARKNTRTREHYPRVQRLPVSVRVFFARYYKSVLGRETFNIGPMLTRPKSRGSIRLRSSDPRDSPLIDPNFLSHPDDVRTFIRGIKFVLAIANTSALRIRFDATFHDQVLPGCEEHVYGSDAYWACYTRHMAQTTYHPVGTCKMAPPSDPSGVVDHRLKQVSALSIIWKVIDTI
ncbi:hypothetical protein O3P69_009822 [Scylla paramamosain]|uniref:Glucose-methanol-choline oxidoreductase C-terminal domain-containing protein n=1 Tax=Scylla paramamosain TaxID=85552 RepID=A0AAW0SMS3_SCYPA